jgi:hypothetical protein
MIPPDPLPCPVHGPHIIDEAIIGQQFQMTLEELIGAGRKWDFAARHEKRTPAEVPDGMPELDGICKRTLRDVRAIAPHSLNFDAELEKQIFVDWGSMIGANPSVPLEILESRFWGKWCRIATGNEPYQLHPA